MTPGSTRGACQSQRCTGTGDVRGCCPRTPARWCRSGRTQSSSKTSGTKIQRDAHFDITQDDIDKWLRRLFWMPESQGSRPPTGVATREASALPSRVARDDSRRRRTTTVTEEGRPPLVVFAKTFCTLLPRGPGHAGAFRCRPGWLKHPSPGFTLVVKRRLAPDGKSQPVRDDV